jgi:cytochrome c-type biogenesis protein CcmF
VALVARNRRRYGGYIVHAGVAIALIGVAASTSFQHQRTATLRPGQSVHTDGYTFKYVRATSSATAQKISLGAVLAVTKNGRPVTTLRTSYGLYPSLDPMHAIGRFFNGSSESQVGLHSGALRDLWVVISPNVAPLQQQISQGDRLLGRALLQAQSLPASQRATQLNRLYTLRDLAIRELAQRFVSHPWSSQFLIEVSPLVMWLWLGAIIAAVGGLVALWPVPGRARTRLHRPARPAPAADAVPAESSPSPARERELV